MARRIGRLTAVLVIAGAVCWPRPAGAQAGSEPVGAQATSEPARAELRTLDGRTLTLESLRGRVVLLDFWATWCAPCLAEMPRLKKLHAAYDRDDFVIIGISLDTLDRRAFRSWVRRNGIEWPQVQDGRAYNSDLARLFGVEKLPVTVLLGRDGRVEHRDLRGVSLETAIAAEISKSTAHKSPTP